MRFIESEFFTAVQYRGKDYPEAVLIGTILELQSKV